ncbi:MAG: biotin--[acetyl-CoA-carboxylase] ligase [Actinomycetota bacterium]
MVRESTVLTESSLATALAAAGLDAPVRAEGTVTSTQAIARDLAEAGAPAWTLVSAEHQTEGRGRHGRTWTDAPGGLLVSTVLRPPVSAPRAGLVPLLAGAAMAEACEEATGVRVVCRWPNDLLVGERKVGGMIAESRIEGDAIAWIVLGVGVNVAAAPVEVDGAAARGGDAAAILGAFLRRLAPLLEAEPWAAVRARTRRPRVAHRGR